MTTTIDSAGRVVVPKALREQAGLLPNTELEIRMVDGVLLLERKSVDIRIERRDGLAILVAPAAPPKMTAEQVDAVREEIRDERYRNAGDVRR
jgi:AbrB family looped-hinge helix DNA binding protein